MIYFKPMNLNKLFDLFVGLHKLQQAMQDSKDFDLQLLTQRWTAKTFGFTCLISKTRET